jgi:hypothetical protein
MDLIILVKLICIFLLFNNNSTLLLWLSLYNYNFFSFRWGFLRGRNCCSYLYLRILWLLLRFRCWFSNTGERIGLHFAWWISILESILSRDILFIIILSMINFLVILFFTWELHAYLLLLVRQAVSSYWRFLVWSNGTSYICQLLIVHGILECSGDLLEIWWVLCLFRFRSLALGGVVKTVMRHLVGRGLISAIVLNNRLMHFRRCLLAD